jgi:Rieske Fe-S protein
MQIERTRGDTIPDVFTVTTVGTGEATNLTGCTFVLTLNTLKNPVDTTTQLYQLAGTWDNPSSGKVSFTPTLAQVDRVGMFYYDVQMTDSFGQVVTLVKGVYSFSQDITK